MNLDWSSDDERFRAEVRDWLADNVPVASRPAGNAAIEFDRAWQRKLYDGGWAGIAWPKEYGGRGLTLLQQMIWFEENAKVGAPGPGVFFVALAHAGPTLLALGTDAQKSEHLTGILRGDDVWCQGFSEPGSGSDLASLICRGVIEGDEIVVTGQKIWTSYADVAEYQELLIRTEAESSRHAGLTWIIGDMKVPGVTVHPIRKLDGHAEFASVFYDGARFPVANVVGEVGQGWKTAMATLGFERGTAFIGEMMTLVMQLEMLIDYAKRNTVAGSQRMLWTDDAMRSALAQHRAELAALRALNYANLSRYMTGVTPGAEGSLMKLFTGQLSQALERTAIEMMGERLLDPDAAEARWMDRYYESIVLAIGGGTFDIQREIVADRVLGLPRSR